MPTPTMTKWIFPGSAIISVSTPQHFPPRVSTSLGHLSSVGTPATSRIDWLAASPTIRLKPGACVGSTAGRKTRDRRRSFDFRDSQALPNRPRPRVCSSATTVVPSGAPASARRRAVSLVEPTLR